MVLNILMVEWRMTHMSITSAAPQHAVWCFINIYKPKNKFQKMWFASPEFLLHDVIFVFNERRNEKRCFFALMIKRRSWKMSHLCNLQVLDLVLVCDTHWRPPGEQWWRCCGEWWSRCTLRCRRGWRWTARSSRWWTGRREGPTAEEPCPHPPYREHTQTHILIRGPSWVFQGLFQH